MIRVSAWQKVVILLTLTVSVYGCRFTSSLLNKPLSAEEQKFIGSWKNSIGTSNTSTWSFNDVRNVNYSSKNSVYGDSSSDYLWEAVGTELVIYKRDTLFLDEWKRYSYSFEDETALVLNGVSYEKQ